MASPMLLGDAVDLTDNAIQKIILKQTTLPIKTYYDKYFNVQKGVDYLEKDSSLSGLSQVAYVSENAVISSEVPVQGFDKTYTQAQFALVLPIGQMMWKYGIKKRKLESIANSLQKAAMLYRETFCADYLDNSFSTSFSKSETNGTTRTISNVGGDGRALVATNHTREDGGADWSNRISDGTTVNMDFDYDAIKAAHRTASLVLDPKGQKMDVNYDTFIFSRGSTPSFRAQEILKGIQKGMMPGSADNDGAITNYAGHSAAFSIIDLPYVTTNTSYWWGMDSTMKGDDYGLQYKESEGITMHDANYVYKTGEIQKKVSLFFDVGFNDVRCMSGSKNTNAA